MRQSQLAPLVEAVASVAIDQRALGTNSSAAQICSTMRITLRL